MISDKRKLKIIAFIKYWKSIHDVFDGGGGKATVAVKVFFRGEKIDSKDFLSPENPVISPHFANKPSRQ